MAQRKAIPSNKIYRCQCGNDKFYIRMDTLVECTICKDTLIDLTTDPYAYEGVTNAK